MSLRRHHSDTKSRHLLRTQWPHLLLRQLSQVDRYQRIEQPFNNQRQSRNSSPRSAIVHVCGLGHRQRKKRRETLLLQVRQVSCFLLPSQRWQWLTNVAPLTSRYHIGRRVALSRLASFPRFRNQSLSSIQRARCSGFLVLKALRPST